MSVEIEGLAELSERLSTMPVKAAKRYLSRCADSASQVVLDAAEETVPVEVGTLEESLEAQKSFDDDDGTTLTVEIGPSKKAFWGSMQEFGTHDQPAQHWLGRAWESSKDKVLDTFVTEAVGILQDLENKD
jgi:HK97 gp10 family phage protein